MRQRRTAQVFIDVMIVEILLKGHYRCFSSGTGKTLVSAMVISRMLQLNPQHTVVFLVDKILLALQQSKVMRQEIGDKTFSRFGISLR
jgi:ERCC4-related helicase